MNVRRSYQIAVAALLLGLVGPGLAQAAPRVVKMQGNDAMKYSIDKIEAKAGEEITISLTTVSSMPKTAMAHNFVLLAPNTDVNGFIVAAAVARKSEYIPMQPKWQEAILAKSGMAGAGETVEVTFTVPKTPGSYVFVCTFPGHFNGGMKGVLIVK